MSARSARRALVLYVLAAGLLTLGPLPRGLLDQWHALLLALGMSVSRTGAEAGANVLLFLPLGLLTAWALPRRSLGFVFVALVAASAAVEVLQTFLATRNPSLRDVLLNGTGAAVGVLLARPLRR